MSYQVKTNDFAGPLDLLLDLIEQQKLKVTEVSLAKIADDFLAQVKKLQEIKAESLVDFLVIASQLLLIKSRALLPLLEQPAEQQKEAGDLARRLAELKRFRIAAGNIAAAIQSKRFSAARLPLVKKVFYPPPKINITDLKKAYLNVLAELPSEELLEEEVVKEVVSLEDKLEIIQNNLNKFSKLSFKGLIDKASKTEIIVTFLAMLELMKQRLVSVDQDQMFGEITIKAVSPGSLGKK